MEKNKKKISILLYTITFISILTMFFSSFSEYIWLDEAFSLKLIQHSYKDVILLTAQDVHPPLYYIILKFFVDIGNSMNIMDKVIGAMVSIIPYIILAFISLTTIRKHWGELTSSIFIFCIILMPNCLFPSTEIRMYSFGMLFVTLAYIEAYEIIITRKWSCWIKFLLWGICAAYTHYFACISVAVVYGYLLLWSVIKERKEFKKWLFISVGTFILYLPWLVVVLKQVAQVKESYWIQPITLAHIYGYIKFVFSPSKGIFMLLLGLFYIYTLLKILFDKNKKMEIRLYVLTGSLVLCLTVLFGIIVSLLMRPIFVDRYIIPSLGCFWLGIAISMGSISSVKRDKIIYSCGLLILLVVGGLNYKLFITHETNEMSDFKHLSSIIEKEVDSDTVIVTDNIHVQFSLSNYLENTIYIYGENIGALSKEVYDNVGVIDLADLEKRILSGETILYWNTGDINQINTILQDIDGDIRLDYIDDANFATMHVSLYKIEQ